MALFELCSHNVSLHNRVAETATEYQLPLLELMDEVVVAQITNPEPPLPTLQ